MWSWERSHDLLFVRKVQVGLMFMAPSSTLMLRRTLCVNVSSPNSVAAPTLQHKYKRYMRTKKRLLVFQPRHSARCKIILQTSAKQRNRSRYFVATSSTSTDSLTHVSSFQGFFGVANLLLKKMCCSDGSIGEDAPYPSHTERLVLAYTRNTNYSPTCLCPY